MENINKKERQSFTFYLSFYKTIKGLRQRERLLIYDAIVEYSLLGKQPADLPHIAQLVWNLVEPILSKSRVKFLNGCRGEAYGELGGAPKGNSNARRRELPPPENNPENNPTDTNTDTNTNTETNTETNTDTAPGPASRRREAPPSKSAKVLAEEYLKLIKSDTMRKAIGEWFDYKRERGEAYRSMKGMHVFCLRLKELSDGNEYRAQQILSNSIANNWSGIFPLKDDYVPKAQRGEGYMRGYS